MRASRAARSTVERERSLRQMRDYYARNAEAVKAASLERYRANPEGSREYRQHYARTRSAMAVERVRAWREQHPEKYREQSRRHNHKRRDAKLDPLWGTYLTSMLLSDPCAYCGDEAGEIDHILPVALGGSGDWDNLASACRRCNARKQARPLLIFLAER